MKTIEFPRLRASCRSRIAQLGGRPGKVTHFVHSCGLFCSCFEISLLRIHFAIFAPVSLRFPKKIPPKNRHHLLSGNAPPPLNQGSVPLSYS